MTGEARHTELALRLCNQVHHTLARHRPDDSRHGWLSGLEDEEGEAHPTRGGLRIGKKLPERLAGEHFDEELEWERDGQYFHYLTKWMHALDQVSRATGRALFNVWARELAQTAHDGFVHRGPGGHKRMAWKMSVDLRRPLVPSMGQHDPIDGLITSVELRATAARLEGTSRGPDLEDVQVDFAEMIEASGWATADPLGIGGLLTDACRAHQLAFTDEGLVQALLSAALTGLGHFQRGELEKPAALRLAFRELGLAIGLAALDHIQPSAGTRASLEALWRFAPLGAAIESFWLAPENRASTAFAAHRDISEVMLATRLVPEGFLLLA
jgi:hypothetical protein